MLLICVKGQFIIDSWFTNLKILIVNYFSKTWVEISLLSFIVSTYDDLRGKFEEKTIVRKAD